MHTAALLGFALFPLSSHAPFPSPIHFSLYLHVCMYLSPWHQSPPCHVFVQWDSFYRFKHLSSEEYLAAVEDTDDTLDANRSRLRG